MASSREDVYATLLLNDFYLPGALVLAHSLRDTGTTRKLAVLYTADGVSTDALAELKKLFDYIIPVERIVNDTPANLHLMDRPDLHSTFTKITLWRQLQFRRIVYVDADMVAIRAPDELFDLPHAFSAAPDIGWPDIFNTGLMVLNPNMGDYYALLGMAQRGISFDGADQGLLNMYFRPTYNRLSFTYNVTPSAHYQYLPAYRHFQSSISMGHFIGPSKPWTQGREAHKSFTPYDEMVGRWWAVYDRHYRESAFQYHVKGEFKPVDIIISSPETTEAEQTISQALPMRPTIEQPLHEAPELSKVTEIHDPPVQEVAEREPEPRFESQSESQSQPQTEAEHQYSAWDASSRAPPPVDSKPEAQNFPATHYDMSFDPTPFKAPERYPDPPKDMYYEVPKTPTYQKPTPIFPWEKDAPKATRVFPEDKLEELDESLKDVVVSARPENEDEKSPEITTATVNPTPMEPWRAFPHANAWDDIPEIERYIGNLKKNRRGNVQVLHGTSSTVQQAPNEPSTTQIQGTKLTDFPTELERPSLPVTPAPIRRPSFWGEERDEKGELPGAEGVPSQEDWDPSVQLEQLARRQSEVLATKLGQDIEPPRQIPLRPLLFGSEQITSPTYTAQHPPTSGKAAEPAPTQSVEELGGKAVEPAPIQSMEEPSYKGPSAAWEKEEAVLAQETPAPPSEEEKDVLET
ncbi:glycosyltransferase family 8 protein [Oidiodendron maius Zn]|uniref:glycogenin glucosyltransferase n=1 Tax=Oidiodendron maius (strain Zn) TaxID=913774 RepID=A0A0C3DV50_OIDMZ|nr:glycosyltransferase family 8 protein [Oidiodendron maius Zn]